MAIIITFILCLIIFKYSIEANNVNFSQFVNKYNKNYFEDLSEVNKTFSGNEYDDTQEQLDEIQSSNISDILLNTNNNALKAIENNNRFERLEKYFKEMNTKIANIEKTNIKGYEELAKKLIALEKEIQSRNIKEYEIHENLIKKFDVLKDEINKSQLNGRINQYELIEQFYEFRNEIRKKDKDQSVELSELSKQFEEFKGKLEINNEKLDVLNTNTINECIESKKLSENNSQQLIQTQKQLNQTIYENKAYLKRFYEDHFYTFNDSDGKQRAFIFPVKENMESLESKNYIHWNKANNMCNKYNASLVEINSEDKQTFFTLFISQFDQSKENGYPYFWLNGRKHSSGNWKWLRSGNDFTYTNWINLNWPNNTRGDYAYATNAIDTEKIGTWLNSPNNYGPNYIICELDVEV